MKGNFSSFDKPLIVLELANNHQGDIAHGLNIIEQFGIQYFNITTYEKIQNFEASILIDISPTEPIYVNQINITGNTRTYDYVFRRELNLYEGDPLNKSKIKKINKKLNRLKFIEKADVSTVYINENLQDCYFKIHNLIKAEIDNGSKDYDIDYVRMHVEKLTS